MDPVAEPSSGIKDALQAAAVAAECASPADTRALVELLGHLRTLEGHLQVAARRDDAKVCQLGAQMTEHLIERRQPPLEALVEWVNGLVQYLGVSLGIVLQDDWSRMRRPPEKKFSLPGGAKLAGRQKDLSDGHRLGDILVQMSFLKASDVERALQIQRETNCRLGEAMVLLGLITEKGLEAALKIQQRKRVSGS